MSIQYEALDVIEERGPVSAAQIAQVLGVPKKRVINAMANAKRHGRAHRCGSVRSGGVGASQALYDLGSGPEWMPDPLPVNSVFELGRRA